MASIEDQLKNVRTLEDIVNILSILFNNMNSISRLYYDIFLNPTPMKDIPVKLYDDNGVLQDREIPNVAYYKSSVLLNPGSPEGVLPASQGAFCIDTLTNDLYYKSEGTDSTGWQKVFSSNSDNFLTPTGSGAQLTDLNMRNATDGPLSVLYGGTGIPNVEKGLSLFNGLVKANGTSPFSEALPDSKYKDNLSSDYVDPAVMVGVVSYYAGNVNIKADEPTIVNGGWFVCNGEKVESAKYPRLESVIGEIYGKTEDGKYFFLPNLIGKYIKGSDQSGAEGSYNVGRHDHSLGEATTGAAGAHTHNRGTMNITGGFQGAGQFAQPASHGNTDPNNFNPWGAFKCKNKRYKVGNKGAEPDWYYEFDASANWTGETSEAPDHTHTLNGVISYNKWENPETKEVEDAPEENDVNHIKMIPIIKF